MYGISLNQGLLWHRRAAERDGDTREGVVVAAQHEGDAKQRRHQRGSDTQLDDAGAGQSPALDEPAA